MNYFTLPNILILFAVVFILFLLTTFHLNQWSFSPSLNNPLSKSKENDKKLEESEEIFSNTLPESKKIEIKEIKYEEVDKEKEKKKAQEELMNLRLKIMEEKATKEVEDEIEKNENLSIKDISPNIIPLKEEDLKTEEVIKPKEEVIEKKYKNIEEKDEERLEQEEMDAIISINELETKGQKMYDSLEKEQLDEEEIPISIEELYETMELPMVNIKSIEKKEEEKVKKEVEEKALYDLTETKEYPLVEMEKDEVITKEQEKNKEILDEELKKTDEFLSFLKELKKNLEWFIDKHIKIVYILICCWLDSSIG